MRAEEGSADLETKFLRFVSRDAASPLFKSMTYKHLRAGDRLIMMRHDMAMDFGFLANFRNEAITIASLNHENIVKVYDIEERFRTVFIIMEYLEGESVADMLGRPKKIPPSLGVKLESVDR